MEAQIVEFLWNTFIQDGILVIAAVFVVGQLIKKLPALDKIPNKYISLIGIVLGAALAAISPDIYPGEDITTAAIKGACLGMMTTGLYEVLKIFFPRLSAKLGEKTADVDGTLSDMLGEVEDAGEQDVEASKTSTKTLEQLVDEMVDALESEEQLNELKSTVSSKVDKALAK